MDPELVIRVQHGDEEAFASLAVAVGDRLHAVAHRILRDTDLAEDATQQALLSIWRDIRQLRDPARFDAWSYQILVRACYTEGRRSRQWSPNLRLLPDRRACAGRARPGRRSRPAGARLSSAFHRSSRRGRPAPLRRPAPRRSRRSARHPDRDGQIPSTSCDARTAGGARCRLAADRAGGHSMSTDRESRASSGRGWRRASRRSRTESWTLCSTKSPRPNSAGLVAGVEVRPHERHAQDRIGGRCRGGGRRHRYQPAARREWTGRSGRQPFGSSAIGFCCPNDQADSRGWSPRRPVRRHRH